MIAPTLSASEAAAVRQAGTMERVRYTGGSVVAVDGRRVLFGAGSAEAFEPLWAQAEALRAEVANGA
jgi:hypothetical protein